MNERYRKTAVKILAVTAFATGFSGVNAVIDSTSEYQQAARTSEDSRALEERDGIVRSTHSVDLALSRAGQRSNEGVGFLAVTIFIAGAAVELNRRSRSSR